MRYYGYPNTPPKVDLRRLTVWVSRNNPIPAEKNLLLLLKTKSFSLSSKDTLMMVVVAIISCAVTQRTSARRGAGTQGCARTQRRGAA